jgi:RNA polymerase sigma-70 factor (ECF subfamily)
VYRLAYGVLLNQQDAEEVVQDSFGYAFQSLRRYDSARSSFRTWLYTITLSRCRNKRRRKWLPTLPLADMVEWLPGREPNPEAAVEQLSIREMVWNALGELSPKQREAIVLRYFDGLTYREMAMVLGCPLKTAESRVRLAHETLYQTLIQQHGKESLFGLFGYD